MKLYKFAQKTGNKVALSNDSDGKNLPVTSNGWVPIGEIDVKRGEEGRIGFSSDEVLDLIDEKGFVTLA